MITGKILGAGGIGGLDISQLFATTLYTGNATDATAITTGLDMSTNEGMVWVYNRNLASAESKTANTVTGATKSLDLSTTNVLATDVNGLQSFDTTGFTVGTSNGFNRSGNPFVAWSFVSAEGFFDVLEYTGNGTTQNIAHNLGVVPGAILVKNQNNSQAANGDWHLYHRSLNGGTTPEDYLIPMADSTDGEELDASAWNSTAPTASVFSLGGTQRTNESPDTYTAYLFGHDASNSGVVQCGGYTGNGSTTGPTITLGWEPQWVLIKSASSDEWGVIYDNVRDTSSPISNPAEPFQVGTEGSGQDVDFTATGFQLKTVFSEVNTNAQTYVYIAIRKAD
jgi:hypothetical protein